jgi:hypothetical protein
LKLLPFSERTRFWSFALLAINPQFIGVNSQAANDLFIIVFFTLSLYYAVLFFLELHWKDLMLPTLFAILATTNTEPGKLSLGESQNGLVTRELEIKNNSRTSITYDLSFVNALSSSGVIPPDFWESSSNVTFNKPSVTIKGRGEAEIKATNKHSTHP